VSAAAVRCRPEADHHHGPSTTDGDDDDGIPRQTFSKAGRVIGGQRQCDQDNADHEDTDPGQSYRY